ncbi:MAG: hypothetical protein SGJ02_14120 [bacterium]|nr:hypothetical protein [bacterium]
MKKTTLLSVLLFNLIVSSSNLFAADGATLFFKSGQALFLDGGYQELSEAMAKLSTRNEGQAVLMLNLVGSTIWVNMSEVIILCRDKCRNIEVMDLRDPARTTINQSISNQKTTVIK